MCEFSRQQNTKMQRLVTFGCSVTYGHGLSDCYIPPKDPGLIPSKFAWPNLVAQSLNVPLLNNGVCGNSNLAILHDILNFQFEFGDVVVVMWTLTSRDLIFGKKNFLGKQQLIPVGFWQNTHLSNSWLETHSLADMATRSWLYLHHATLYLKSKNIPIHNVFAFYDEVKKYKPKFLDLDFYKIKTQAMRPIDLALDNLHPGIKTHQMIANDIIKIL